MTYTLTSGGFFDDDFLNDTQGMQEGETNQEAPLPEILGILPLKNTVLFPGVVMPITVGRDKSIQLVKKTQQSEEKLIGVLTQRVNEVENPGPDDLFEVGTVAKIIKMLRMPDGSVTIIIQGKEKFKVSSFVSQDPYLQAKIQPSKERPVNEKRAKAYVTSLKRDAFRIIDLSPNLPSEAKIAIENIDSLAFLLNFIASNLRIDMEKKQEILEIGAISSKAEAVLQHLGEELKSLELSEEIQIKVRNDMDRQQREYMLRQQMKTIQDELGEIDYVGELDDLRKRAAAKLWSDDTKKAFEKELAKLARTNPSTPEYGISLSYVEWLLDLPWYSYTPDDFDFKKVRKTLDDDHYGLDDVKERILEHLAVLKLKNDKKAPILCFYGPPGVGKTSLGKSIAEALGKEFIRISLGGVRDEAEIRGHRKTYIGALPGRIIQGMKKAKTGNPVFMLDELDKVGSDFRGDPSAALLEVLDPEQNNSFRDHYLEVEYDLSRVMFIGTANTLSTLHPALRDRMEIITISSYSLEEKVEIAKKHLVPKIRKDHGIEAKQLKFTNNGLKAIIERYTIEAGVRNLGQKIGAICRKVAKIIVENGDTAISITDKNLAEYLGVEKFEPERYQNHEIPGVCVGLAWTSVGGDILFVESTLIRGNGGISLTGKLGDVMRESANVAYTYLRAHTDELGIPIEAMNKWNVHVHFPDGATPKDGPSAGITILTALASLFTQRPVKPALAMTGEITLRGKVLPVGGIKEKVLAAVRAGIKTIIMCKDNQRDVSEIKEEYLKGIEIKYVTNMHEVLELALEKKQIAKPLNLLPKESKEDKKKSENDKEGEKEGE